MSSDKKRKLDVTEELGVNAVSRVLLKMGWQPRDQRAGDYGVDLQAEMSRPDGTASGRLLALQVKAGPSYFAGGNANEIIFYTDQAHIDYWKDSSLPVVVVFHNTETDETLWQWAEEAKPTAKQWRLAVPKANVFDESVKDRLAKVMSQGRSLDPATAARLGTAVAEAVASDRPDNVKSNAIVVSGPRGSQAVPPKLHADVGTGGLSNAALDQIAKLLDEKLRPLQASSVEASSGGSTDPRRASEDPALHARLDMLRDIKNDGNPAQAHRMVSDLLVKIDAAASPFAYFRARTNLAASALDLGLTDEAVRGFEEAYELEPENALAIANLGLARLLQGRHQEAFNLSKNALEGIPPPSHAITVLLGAAARLDLKEDPKALIPTDMQGSDEAEFAAIEYLRVKNAPEWIGQAIAAYSDHQDDIAFKRLWAHAVLEAATTDSKFVPGGQSEVTPDQVSAAANMLRAEVEKKITGGYSDKVELSNEATNAAIAFRVIDDYQSGIDLLRRVHAETGPQPSASRMLALLEALNGNESGALSVIATIPDDGEAQLLKAEILGRSDPKAALLFARGLDDAIVPTHHKTSRWIVVGNLANAARDRAALDEAINHVRADPSRAVYADILAIRWRAGEGESDEVLADELALVADNLPHDASFAQRVTLAQALKHHNASVRASRVLDGHVDMTRDTEATRLYIELLAESGRDRDFHEALAALPASALNDPEIVWLRTVRSFNRGDLDDAEKNARHLVGLKPDLLQPTLLLLESLVRRRRDQAIRRILATPVEALKSTDPTKQSRLARLLIGFGFQKRGLALLYRLLLENRDDARLWVSFGAMVLDAGRKDRGILEAPTVADDVSVRLLFASGQDSEFVVEPDPLLRKLDPDAREPDHPDVVAVCGLKPGDAFTLPDGRQGTVGELRHKFVARMQATLQQFEERFPTVDGFKSIQVDVEAEGGLDAVKVILKARSEFLDEEASAYETGSMPLAVFAYRISTSTIDAADGLAQVGRKFQVAIGEESERRHASKSLEDNAHRGAVVDSQTFWTIWSLEIADLVEATVGKIHYSANALLDLQARLERLEDSVEDGLTSMAFQQGQIALSVINASDIRTAMSSLQAAIEWLETNAILTPVNIPDVIPDAVRVALLDMGAPLFDEIFIAKEKDLLLLVDDLRVRQWGNGLGVERSSWLHWALGHAVENSLAEMSSYVLWSAKLLARGQNYLGLSPAVFFEALRQDLTGGLRRPSYFFEILARCLGGSNADLDSHIRVTAQIIYGIWRGTEFLDIREAATGILLRRVTAERYDDHGLILGLLMRVFRSNPYASDYIRDWAKGHFLNVS